jgi:hypothetical protein
MNNEAVIDMLYETQLHTIYTAGLFNKAPKATGELCS